MARLANFLIPLDACEPVGMSASSEEDEGYIGDGNVSSLWCDEGTGRDEERLEGKFNEERLVNCILLVRAVPLDGGKGGKSRSIPGRLPLRL